MKLKIITLILVFFVPLLSQAETLPSFPMAFYGSVTVDGQPAPQDSVIRVYGANDQGGSVTVKESGVYGYTEATKQKLLIKETDEELVFSIQSPAINGGVETKGVEPVTHSAFESGETVNKDLSFVLSSSNNSSSGGGGSSSRGGGGGSGGSSNTSSEEIEEPANTELILGASTSISDSEERILLQKQLITILTQLISLLQMKIATM